MRILSASRSTCPRGTGSARCTTTTPGWQFLISNPEFFSSGRLRSRMKQVYVHTRRGTVQTASVGIEIRFCLHGRRSSKENTHSSGPRRRHRAAPFLMVSAKKETSIIYAPRVFRERYREPRHGPILQRIREKTTMRYTE